MFDKLIDLLIDFIGLFQFWIVIDCYEQGVVLQFGKYRRTLGSGIYLVCPFGIDNILIDNIVLQTMDMGTQSLHDKAGVKIVISSFITYKITDIKIFLTEVESAEDVIMSLTYGVLSKAVQNAFWEDIQTSDFNAKIKNKIGRKLSAYGVQLINVDFQDMSESKTLRLLTSDINLNMETE